MSKASIPATIREIRIKIYFPRPGTVEILEDVLASLGVPREELAEHTTRRYQCLAFYAKTSSRLRALAQKIEELNLKGVRLEQRSLNKKEWQDRWKEDFKPFYLGKNFVVVPRYLQGRYKAGRRDPVYVETAMAFGSGLHETTRFMAQLIEYRAGRFHSFLDIGAGTGILSMVAARCGADEIHAVDFNPDCVAVARENFKRNHTPAASLKVADIHRYRVKRRYDFVAANLVTHNLIQAGHKISALVSPGGYLAVSGISLENYRHLREAFRKYPLRAVKILRGKEWAAVLYKNIKGKKNAGNEKRK
ncbi:MAG: 50S ribosomal protein L11 methyltransferase [Candidatus Omnitrophica bacterium]|nr:50S ribosomal protein L11 methyltransferase [Candidatus Omnitrophota bacterium]